MITVLNSRFRDQSFSSDQGCLVVFLSKTNEHHLLNQGVYNNKGSEKLLTQHDQVHREWGGGEKLHAMYKYIVFCPEEMQYFLPLHVTEAIYNVQLKPNSRLPLSF